MFIPTEPYMTSTSTAPMDAAPAGIGRDLIRGARAAADYLGLSEKEVFNMAASGHLPVIKKGRRLFFRKSALDRAFSADGNDAKAVA